MKDVRKNIFSNFKSGKIKLDSRVNIFLFCLFLSVFFWFLSALSKSYSTTLRVPIEYEELPIQYMMTKAPQNFIDIQVSGSGFDLLGEQMKLNRKPVLLDLTRFISSDKSQHTVASRYLSRNLENNLDEDLRLEGVLLDSVSFKTFKRVEKLIDITANLKLSFMPGFGQRGKLSLNPSQVKVFGSKEALSELKSISTEEISMNDLSDSIQLTAKLITPQNEELLIEESEVELIIPVERFTEKEFEINITAINELDSTRQLRTFPDKIKAVFLVPLNTYEVFNQNLLKAEVIYSREELGKKKLNVSIKGAPEYAKLIRTEPGRVEFIVLN